MSISLEYSNNLSQNVAIKKDHFERRKNMNTAKAELFSVCVFVYNNIEGLEKTIRSVFGQSYPNIELFISDDHSDNLINAKQYIERIAEPYKNRFQKLMVNVNAENVGTVKHINKILPLTSGNFLCLLGSGDCLYKPDVLSKAADYLLTHDCDICYSKRKMQLNAKKYIVLPSKRISKLFGRKDDALLNICCREVNHITTIGCFFKKKLFQEHGFFDENYILLEDAPYFLNLLFQRVPIGFLDEITCLHEKGGISNRKKTCATLEADSIRTLTDIKYKRRRQLTWLTQRVVVFKYQLRTTDKMFIKLLNCFKYPDAALFLVFFVMTDWIKRLRYL